MLEVVFPASTDTFTRQEAAAAIARVPNVARVDDGSLRLAKALTSLRWLGVAGALLAAGLWVVLFIVCLGYYQGILYTDAQELLLVRSFGATKTAILLPWLIEAVIQSVATGALCIALLLAGRSYLSELYNQFFGTIGYEAFRLDLAQLGACTLAITGMALAAHALAGITALLRGRIA
jgi:cell division protein FtsX